MPAERPHPSDLVALLGAHPSTACDIRLDSADDTALGDWLVLSILLGGRTREAVATAAFGRLQASGWSSAAEIAAAGVAAVHEQLEAAEVPKSEGVAAVIVRVCAKLSQQYGGSIDRLAAECDDLEQLAGKLSRLGAGFGRAAVLRFLTPLRDRWSAANDLPATSAVCSAAEHLALIVDRVDAEGTPAVLTRWLRNESETDDVLSANLTPRDVEAALERLGRAACLRERADRCPLAERCPRNAQELQ